MTTADIRNLAAALAFLAIFGVGLRLLTVLATIDATISNVPGQIDDRAAKIEADLKIQASAAEADLNDRLTQSLAIVDYQITRARTDVVGQIVAARSDITGPILGTLDRHLATIEKNEADQANNLSLTVAGTGAALIQVADTYSALPGLLGARLSPAWDAIEPEITDRKDGRGYVGWHSRISGLMGEALNVGGVFTQRFPQLSLAVTGIATDAHTFTSKAVSPCLGWCLVRSTLTTGSGVTRALGAAGVF